jgi:hypothetical protein
MVVVRSIQRVSSVFHLSCDSYRIADLQASVIAVKFSTSICDVLRRPVVSISHVLSIFLF